MSKPGMELDNGFPVVSPQGTGFSPNDDRPSFFLRAQQAREQQMHPRECVWSRYGNLLQQF